MLGYDDQRDTTADAEIRTWRRRNTTGADQMIPTVLVDLPGRRGLLTGSDMHQCLLITDNAGSIRADEQEDAVLPHCVDPLRVKLKSLRADIVDELRVVELVRQVDVH